MALIDNILAYWKLDNNGSGGVSLVDSTPNGRTLIAPAGTAGLSLGNGIIGGDASFDGDGLTYLSIDGSFLSPSGAQQSQYSVSLWVKTTNDIFIVNSITGNNWTGGTITLDVSDGQIFPSVWWGDENGGFDRFASGPDLRDGNWHHCAFTWDAFGDLIAYVDGVETGRIAAAGNLANVDVNNLSFNSNADGTFFAGQLGQIDEVGIWNRVLTSAEVTALYNIGNGLSYPFTPLFFNAAVNGSLTTLGNWWQDSGFTIPADALPANSSLVVIAAPPTSGTATYSSALITANIGSAVSITASEITLNSGINSGTIIGSVILNNSSSNAGTITGYATLNGYSSNAGTITGNATIYNPSANPIGGVVTGSETYLWPNGTGLWGNEVWIDGSSSFIIPIESDVRAGVEYGPASAPYVGTYSGGGGAKKAISISQLLKLPFPINI
jgi:hypothetical protein